MHQFVIIAPICNKLLGSPTTTSIKNESAPNFTDWKWSLEYIFYKHSVFFGGKFQYAYDLPDLTQTSAYAYNILKMIKTCCHSHNPITTSEGPTRIHQSKNSEISIQWCSLTL